MSLWQLILLALVQGLTEFLPISSSAHLILASEVLGWPDQGLAFDTAVHLGTLGAVLWYFRSDLQQMLPALTQPRSSASGHLAWAIALGSIPALTIGFFAADWIEHTLRGPQIIAVTTLLFAALLWQADRWGHKQRQLTQLSWRDAMVIGLLQVLALVPGTSRAGITMTAALWLGFERAAAARFSFLLAIPVLAGAGAYSVLKLLQAGLGGVQLGVFLGAAALSGLVALLTVHAFVRLVDRVGMLPFVLYRLALGVFLVLLFF